MYTHKNDVITRGKPLSETGKALILVHGRGATAQSILDLANHLPAQDFTLYAPQATNNSWYPYSFMAPEEQNQPALDSALERLDELVKSILDQGVKSEELYLGGFSQGACLTSEYATRNARKFGGLLLFTGGLIGQQLVADRYKGNFEGTPVLLTTGDPDPHVPVSRVEETAETMEKLGAVVTKKIYHGRPHTILQEELDLAGKILSSVDKG
ncbi:dienelactone hydrolase family protein [Pontibacter sp. BT310]|uniref:Dienelactone hydrolase family protein n=1 Tax=Pontibacter populi TaxID=890055 RepID=A0ABS6XF54_9BACT|nr:MULTISPECIES: dienelactone hydrolase family protein [Pontibacter]MBJ6118897.1 dienelactone hydrolase family protein [Pontibacter sp. BT310]MBR0571325.1 dienelactone hydrolase family protein [Microvirga sp. STS03]MBW3365751.1 dienelactone hydrolase family protein [Pontibacter populi]